MPDDAQVSISACMIDEGATRVNGPSWRPRRKDALEDDDGPYFIESGDTARPTREAS